MICSEHNTVNEAFEPGSFDEEVLSHFKEEDRLTPRRLVDLTDESRQRVSKSLDRLTAAGWIRKVTRGLYEYVDDPRE